MKPFTARLLLVLLLPLAAACGGTDTTSGIAAVESAHSAPAVGHVFVINLENKGFTRTWGKSSAAPYLAHTLRGKGVLLTRYYGTAHHSLGNYLAQVSGQGPNPAIQADCRRFTALHTRRIEAPQQRVGTGCVFDAATPTLMKQIDKRHLGWRGYLQGMDRSCEHPRIGALDNAFKARPHHEYATRHNPFVYFRSVIDRPTYCRRHVVSLPHLRTDLQKRSTTRFLSYITPDLCNDAHDSPCADGRRGGLPQLNRWLKTWVPRILKSPAFRHDGVLVITADESDGPRQDSTACCGEGPSANAEEPGIDGPGGGRVGALVISRWTGAGTRSSTPYNHYSLLGSIEEMIGARPIGYARTPGLHFFGADVFNR
ncbi:alkaline phosphatase family protein [Nocardioides terrisoli]|uniref:alkaline phosphatase family protein n=1 Tax=Nocardioides terrisoli TaxID=3388267 RepID=UPI00287B7C0B|nr:alkaline phosphatase family protein [Nocardioides marmorisolisilvae]